MCIVEQAPSFGTILHMANTLVPLSLPTTVVNSLMWIKFTLVRGESKSADAAIVLVAACASTPAYGPAAKSGAMGYESLQIENNRFRVSYTDTDAAKETADGEDVTDHGQGWSDDHRQPGGTRT